MAVPKTTIWSLDPHTLAKHEILKRYLQCWFPILNTYHGRIIYIDGFCGPGRYSKGESGSPIIALDVAATHRKALGGEIVFWFIDEREDRIDHLKSELRAISVPSHFKVHAEFGDFREKLEALLNRIDGDKQVLAPAFVFIDPFGFARIPFSLVRRLLQKKRCEVLITFMVDSINRFLEHPDEQIVGHIDELFGAADCISRALASPDRINALRDIYQQQLKSVAKFVRYFEMRGANNRRQYFLFFAGNHPLGHVKMKEAMWRTDATGNFRFSDATNPLQPVLFEMDPTAPLWAILHGRFAGQEVLTDRILEFVNDKTAFLGKHMKATLKKHLNEGQPSERILVKPIKEDGTKWVRGSFPNRVFVTFPPRRT
jgi:three-Cys-motif partner protein